MNYCILTFGTLEDKKVVATLLLRPTGTPAGVKAGADANW